VDADAADWSGGFAVEASGREACSRMWSGARAFAIYRLRCRGDLASTEQSMASFASPLSAAGAWPEVSQQTQSFGDSVVAERKEVVLPLDPGLRTVMFPGVPLFVN